MLIRADFNARDNEGNVLVLAENFEEGVPGLRSVTLLVDSDGNSAEGEIVGEDNGLVAVAVRWNTWQPAPEPIEFFNGSYIVPDFTQRRLFARAEIEQSLLEVLTGAVRSTRAVSASVEGIWQEAAGHSH